MTLRKTTSKVISSKVNAEEFGIAWQKAAKEGKTVSRYIYDLIFNAKPITTLETGGTIGQKNEISDLQKKVKALQEEKDKLARELVEAKKPKISTNIDISEGLKKKLNECEHNRKEDSLVIDGLKKQLNNIHVVIKDLEPYLIETDIRQYPTLLNTIKKLFTL